MTGFVFGKFLPFHKGHQALIEFAAKNCDVLIVLVCSSEKEPIPGQLRLQWIQETFAGNARIRPMLFEYSESELPNTSVSSQEVSALWSNAFKKILPPEVGILMSSEPYGEFVAHYMGIEHLVFDPSRNLVPVSGTMIRNNTFKYWDYLPDVVKPYYHKKVVLLGTESTGKTTLAERLSEFFGVPWVSEAGRELIPSSTKFSLTDLYRVAETHYHKVLEALNPLPPLLILDTDIHITQSYAQFSFGQYLDLPEEWYRIQKAHLYLYSDKDAPYIQDGSRLSEAERNSLDDAHRATLEYFGIRYETLSGTWQQRQSKASSIIVSMKY